MLKCCIRPIPSEASELPLNFAEVEQQFLLNEIDNDIKCAALMPFLTSKARLLIAKLSTGTVDTYPKLRDALLAEHKLTP